MRRALRLAGSLVGLVVIGIMLAALALVFGGRLGAGGRPQVAQQPYPPPATPTPGAYPAPPTVTPVPISTRPATSTAIPPTRIPSPTATPPIPTPASTIAPEGIKLIYAIGRGRTTQIEMTDVTAGRRQTIANLTWTSDYSVVGVFPSPDRRYIALSLQGYEGDTPLWLVNADGTGARFLMIGVFIGWAPNSTKIYVNKIGGKVGIQEVNIVAGTSRYLIEEYAIDPALSPDGQKIAFSSFQSGPGKSWILRISDLSKSAIAKTGHFANSEFAWSPDSRKLTFTVLGQDDTNFYHAGELWMVDSDGQNPVRLSKEGEQDFDPDWSPDGRMLAYAHREAASDEASREDPMSIVSSIWLLDLVSRTRESVISANGVGNMAPRWSPDSNKIAYIAKRGASSEIYLWDAVNRTVEQISVGPITITGGRHAPLTWVP